LQKVLLMLVESVRRAGMTTSMRRLQMNRRGEGSKILHPSQTPKSLSAALLQIKTLLAEGPTMATGRLNQTAGEIEALS
jgi:hypothetical protein